MPNHDSTMAKLSQIQRNRTDRRLKVQTELKSHKTVISWYESLAAHSNYFNIKILMLLVQYMRVIQKGVGITECKESTFLSLQPQK